MKLPDSEVLKLAAEIVARQAAWVRMINSWPVKYSMRVKS